MITAQETRDAITFAANAFPCGDGWMYADARPAEHPAVIAIKSASRVFEFLELQGFKIVKADTPP